jgi:hypothetical protein
MNETLTATLKQLKMRGDRDPMASVLRGESLLAGDSSIGGIKNGSAAAI